jgi:hypothetical protein
VVKDGKAEVLPTDYVGALRVRARAVKRVFYHEVRADGHVVELEFSLEPKAAWQRLVGLRLDKALDDRGQALTALAGDDKVPAGLPGGFDVPFVPIGATEMFAPLRLKRGALEAKSLKELKGILTAEVLAPPEPVITVDDLFKASGRTFTGEAGASLEVLEATRAKGGAVTVRLALEPPRPSGPAPEAGGRAVPVLEAIPIAGTLFRGPPGRSHGGLDDGLSLVDDQGHAIPVVRQGIIYRGGEKGPTHMHELTFRLAADQQRVKLVFSAVRRVTIDVPFTLRNVPLP